MSARSCAATLGAASLLAILASAGCGGSNKGSSTSSRTASTPAHTSSAPSTNSKHTGSLIVGGPSREVALGVVRASAGETTATMRVSGHHPRVNAGWPVSFTVERAGKRLSAWVSYEYLFAGQVVARRSHYRFKGTFHDVFRWPASAVGYPLTFRAAITATGVVLNLDYPVQVQR